MSPVRSSLVLIACSVVGCASAREQTNLEGNADAAVGGGGGSDGAHPDARMPDGGGQQAGTDAGTTGSGCAFSGVLATWSFNGETGNQTSTASMTTATGVTASALQRSATLTAVSGANSINSSGWPTAASRDSAKYYTVTITPPATCMVALTTVAIDAKASGTGPASAVASTSVDAFAQTTTLSTAAPATITLDTSPTSSAIELRVYGFSAGAAGGTLRLQTTLTVNGTLQ